jgi:hypothetical protein
MMKRLSLALLVGALSGARAELQMIKGGDMCAGYDDASDDFKIYYGPCASAETVATTETTPYFTAETQEMALISGGDSAYLTDTSKITEVDATGTYSNADADQVGPGGATFAYVIGQATATADGLDATGTFGTAFYLVQTGSISTSTNTFPTESDGTGTVDICIAEITDGVCGDARTWNAGSLKYTLYGHLEGADVTTALDGQDYIGVRQHVTLQRFDPETVSATFNDGIELGAMGGTDVTSFSLDFDGKKVTHTFPSKYNVGSSTDCATESDGATTCPTTVANSFTRDIKIKVSPDGSGQGVYFDYLFALAPSASGVNDGLNTANRYFVYDPDVSEESVPTPDPDEATPEKASSATMGAKAMGATLIASLFLVVV